MSTPITIDISGLTAWIASKTTISSIAAVIVYLAGTRGFIDYTTSVELATVLSGLAVIFLRNAVAKVEGGVKTIEEAQK